MDLICFCLIFALSALLFQSAYYREQYDEKFLSRIVLSGMLLVIPAAIRSNDIGTDIAIYQYPLFRYALNSSSISNYFVNAFVSDVESLYALLVYIIAKVTGSINVLYFIEECLIVYPVLYFIWYYRYKTEPGYVLLAYETLFYFDSYNIVRQWLAIAFGLVAFVNWQENKKMKAITLLVVSTFLHKTAIIMIAVIALYDIYIKMERGKFKYFLMASISGLTLYFSINYEMLITLVVQNVSFLRERYALSSYLYRERADFPVLFFLLWILFIYLLIVIHKGYPEDSFIGWNIMMLSISVLSVSFYSKANFVIRVLLYVQVFSIFAAGYCKKVVNNNIGSIGIYTTIYYILLSSVWIYNNYINGVHRVFPYHTVWFAG